MQLFLPAALGIEQRDQHVKQGEAATLSLSFCLGSSCLLLSQIVCWLLLLVATLLQFHLAWR
jgi:hypothetical protein